MENKAKTQKSTLIKDALALFLITLVSGLALSYVFEITKAPIAEQAVIKSQKANQAVFTDAATFEKDEELTALADSTDLSTINADYKGITIDEISKALDSNSKAIGYDITVSTANGYGNLITIVIGYSNDGVIEGTKITSINETPGLGMKAKEPDFIDQFLGKNVEIFTVTKTGATLDDQIDAISGATITSKAVTNAINAGISFIKENAKDFGGGQNE